MSDVSRVQAHHALLRMGYELVAEEGGVVMYRDTIYPGDPEVHLKFDFSIGSISRLDLQIQLEHEGINPDVFFTEVDSF